MKCMICGNSDHFDVLSSIFPTGVEEVEKLTFFRCSKCNFCFTYPYLTDQQLDNYYKDTDYFVFEINPDWKIRESKFRMDLVGDRLFNGSMPSKLRLLEVGSSYGYFLEIARKRGFLCEGIELNEKAIKKSRVKQIPVHRETLESLGKASEYDVIVSWHVLEHIQYPHDFLNQVNQALKPNGNLALAVPNMDSIHFAVKGVNWSWFGMPHICMYSPHTITLLLRQHGFEVVSIESFDYDEQNVLAELLLPLSRRLWKAISCPIWVIGRMSGLFGFRKYGKRLILHNHTFGNKLFRVKLGKYLNQIMFNRGYLQEAWKRKMGSEIQVHAVKF